MTSSALAGERRWGSARRGGMTVLGKVAVPKPLNLPSQRLENHGVDPNVEIVPKGTHSWGNCSSSSTSATNAWGSSSADSKANSPGRPSSGGSGTRPSTAGSDRVNGTSGNAWGPNSRPSSASGILSSSQSSLTSLRPHSAEPRPASSQLSRFAEPVSDSQGSCIASGTSERLGMVSSKREDFSLNSGDFPTLGSEKDQSSNISESKDLAPRTVRSPVSGGEAPVKDEMGIAFDRLKIDSSQSLGEGPYRSMEKWQDEHQQYFNPNIPPQQFDAWRGPPMNAPSGVWYRGGPQGGPPFGPPVAPGGFPIEPFPYYPQIPPPAFANSHPVPPPRGGPRGHHPNSGNPYRPKMHDAFMHPRMPYRPGFYPPPMAFESYYGPPRGYHSRNEPDIPFTEANRPVYDGRYSAPNAPGPYDSHARAGRPGPAGRNNSDVDFSRSGDSPMPVKFLSRQQVEWDEKGQAKNREHMQPDLAAHPVNSDKNVVKPRKYEWGAEDDGDDGTYPSAHFGGGRNYEKTTDECKTEKLVSVSTSPLVFAPKELESAYPPTAKDATLMRKIEGLNAKVSSDGRADCFSSGEEQKCGLDATIGKVDIFPQKPGYAPAMEKNSISEAVFSHEVVGPGDHRAVHQTAAPMLRRPYHGMSNRSDHGGKGKFGNQPADGWQRRPPTTEIPNVVSASEVESGRNFIECGFQQEMEVAEIHQPRDGGGFNKKLQDSTGSQAQRAKMREMTKQRAMQLQREEDERIKDQKAKALAKLEELNRRTQSGDASDPLAKKSVSSETSKEQQEGSDVKVAESVIKLETEGALVNDEKTKVVLGSSITSKVVPVEPLKVIDSAKTSPLKHDVVNASVRDGESYYELDDRLNKSTIYKQKHNNAAVKNYNENSVSVYSIEGGKSPTGTSVKDREPDVASSEVCSSKQTYSIDIRNNISPSSVEHRRNNRSSKSKNKHNDAALVSNAVATGPTQTVPPEISQKILMPQAPSLQLSFGSIQVAVDGESGLEMPHQPSLPNEDTRVNVSSQLKPQHTRRMLRVQQVNNKLHADAAAVWAPVRSQNKVDISEEDTAKLDHKQGPESGPSGLSANLAHSSSRSKRAEMERYIPKPVAKELAEQVGMQPILSSIGTSTLDVPSSVQHVGSATVYAGSSVEQGQGLMKHNKSGKAHGAWRQRGSTGFSHAKNILQIPSDSDTSKSCFEGVSLNQSNPESDRLQAVTKTSSVRNDSASKIASLSSDVPAPETHHVPEDTVITGKGRHYSYKGHKKSGNNDDINISNAESDRSHVQTPFPGTNQTDRAITPKENRASSERTPSHWQPKGGGHSVSGQKGSRITGNQGDGWESSTGNRKDYPLQQPGRTSQHNESNDIDESHSELVPEREAEGNHEPRRGRKLTSSKSSNHNTTDVELGVVDSIDVQQVQQFPVGTRRSGNPVNRSGRGHESHGDLPVQGNRQHDRPRHMHYEYQPVGSLEYKKNNFEGQGDGIRNAGSRNRGRDHSHPRRGGGNYRFPRSEHHQLATE